ncbi:YgdI/YgdR family lipoprotein [Ectopseudomonas hydrolytica]|uniref:YgdI/YgdR family lipoprotein n=1 Tax=Ectopseudomonas hydrolytica TaxID=2493633 RepID=UPI0020B8D673|nr:YgdI/YgdR family lipoprotein [Pseudomonas hydrolytica]UTH34349.1 YgdI/YgdR family lipoprotein [Pseudomonas hydrolytica]UZZ13672.1 YgdI/YgdR family lipoprotein [Pseudomonas mendocina]
MKRHAIACALVACCAVLAGCAGKASTPSLNGGQTYRLDGEALGVPVSGAVRVGIGSRGLYLQPSFNMRQIRLSK